MAQKIVTLNDDVIDQIAAGEVVDRPAHMVKELLENSVDSQATEVTVDFVKGGRSVTIKDNGHGIDSEDLALALSRHATSKIMTADDLWHIGSYGFRGEALASIAAVSQLKIISRTHDKDMGAEIESRFGNLTKISPIGAELGTTIIVEDLYENVPARLKFLKSEAGESTAIKLQLKALALANPHIQFRILQDGQLLYFWSAVSSHKERAIQVLDNSSLYDGSYIHENFNISVVVSSPNETVKNARQIWLFVRGRYVQDRSLQAAVLEGYRNLLMHGEYPVAVVHINCDPGEVDVNVSPTKSQVKFKDSSSAFRAVHRAVRGVLEKSPWLSELLIANNQSVHTGVSRTGLDRVIEGVVTESSNFVFSAPELSQTQFSHKKSMADFSIADVKNVLTQLKNESAKESQYHKELSDHQTQVKSAKWSLLEVLGQAHLTYIITQKDDAILFIDQHAAHERVMFEKLMKNYAEGKIEVQNFLLPVTIDLSEDAVQEVMKLQLNLQKLGLHIDQSGPEQLAITAAPAIVKPSSLGPMFERLVNEITERGQSFQIEKTISDLVATFACHSAIRAGQSLTNEEMKALLVQMDEFPFSSFCPHGRPVYVDYPIRKLERDFGRTV